MSNEIPPLGCPFTDTPEKCPPECPFNIAYRSTVGIIKLPNDQLMTLQDFKKAFNNDPKLEGIVRQHCVITNQSPDSNLPG